MKSLTITLTLLSIFTFVNFGLAQPAGSLDPTFGTGGKVVTSIENGSDQANGVALQADGKIVVAGFSTSSITGKNFTCIRYNVDGSIDNTFGVSGSVTIDLQTGSEDVANDLAIQADGRIILAGYSDDGSNKNAALVRLDVNGTLDNTFGTNGIVITDFDNSQQDEIRVVKVNEITGNIIVGGTSLISNAVARGIVARYLPNGSLDTNFDSNGIKILLVEANDNNRNISVEDLSVKSNGKISAVGWKLNLTTTLAYVYWIGRISSDGSMDLTFSTDGVVSWNEGNGSSRAYGMVLTSNDDIVLAGSRSFSGSHNFRKLTVSSSGTIPATSTSYSFSGNVDIAYCAAEDMNGKFVMAGSSGTSLANNFAVARTNANNSLDNSFDTDGKVTTSFNSNVNNECFDVLVQPDNKIVVVGYSGNDFAIARYLGNDTPMLDDFQLQSPTDLATDINYNSVSFNWTDAYGAVSYELEYDTSPMFNVSPMVVNSASSTNTLSNLAPNTTYYWRVRASDGTNWGQFTGAWSFTTNSLENFILISPANSALNVPFTNSSFDWTEAIGASAYELQIDQSSTFSISPQVFSSSQSTTTIPNLLPNTVYYWRVRASDGVTWGQYSSPWSFTTNTLENFSLLLPPNNSINQPFASLTFDWSDVSGATGYEVEIDSSQTFTVNPQIFSSTTSSYTVINLNEGTAYFWRVRATDGSSWGQWSNFWKFTTESTTSTDELAGLTHIDVFPNPTLGDVTIDLGDVQTKIDVRVYSMRGELLLNEEYASLQTVNLYLDLPSGQYILEIGLENDEFKRVRLVVQ
ncbi:MAG: fibronectin type III domain-containing protein [Crocinitomicaceae bacterium]